ncbi:hypothetical protein [Shewanella sp. 38A_GOM-205m]|uniref:hypothetical protein n=1 Tax=Shewanella sp. 38A_GOM-205m TaxID=1380363 RepID=UPI00048AF7E1|nr:hypothetical protein [Shewanella sp. 38A_GOM-205m]
MNNFIFLVNAEALWAPRGTVACLKDKNMNNFIFLVNAEALWAPRGTVACLKDKNMNNFIFLVNAEAVWAPRGTVVSESYQYGQFPYFPAGNKSYLITNA